MKFKPFVDLYGIRCTHQDSCGVCFVRGVISEWCCPSCGFKVDLTLFNYASHQINAAMQNALHFNIEANQVGLADFEPSTPQHIEDAMCDMSHWDTAPDLRITRMNFDCDQGTGSFHDAYPLHGMGRNDHLFADAFTHAGSPLCFEESLSLAHLAPLCAALCTWNSAVVLARSSDIHVWPDLYDPVRAALQQSKSGREPHV